MTRRAAAVTGYSRTELRRPGPAVRTASPAPERFAAAYAAAAAAGAEAIVSIHLSGRMSGTVGAARLAAAAAPVPVRVIDSGSLGMGLGFAVLSAAEVAGAGGSARAGRRGGGPPLGAAEVVLHRGHARTSCGPRGRLGSAQAGAPRQYPASRHGRR